MELLETVTAWLQAAWARSRPAPAPELDDGLLASTLAVVGALIVLPPLWRRVRVAVTVVHELGHGLVGILCGRRFTGLVLRADMSGHAVTAGRPRGPGRVLSTWAGYPAPALVGALLIRAAGTGWSGPVLGAATVVLLLSLVRVRSLYTAAVMVLVTAGSGALWWWGGTGLRAAVLLGAGAFLLVGAWRHLGALVASPSPGSDAAVLARLTRVPAALWVLSFALAAGLATWVAARPALAAAGL